MNSSPLNRAGSVNLDGSGNGAVTLSPNVGQTWRLTVASVVTSTSVLIPKCSIFMGGAATQDFFVDGTYTGNLNSTDAVSGLPLTHGQKIIALWTGGDPGAVATLSIIGTVETGR